MAQHAKWDNYFGPFHLSHLSIWNSFHFFIFFISRMTSFMTPHSSVHLNMKIFILFNPTHSYWCFTFVPLILCRKNFQRILQKQGIKFKLNTKVTGKVQTKVDYEVNSLLEECKIILTSCNRIHTRTNINISSVYRSGATRTEDGIKVR